MVRALKGPLQQGLLALVRSRKSHDEVQAPPVRWARREVIEVDDFARADDDALQPRRGSGREILARKQSQRAVGRGEGRRPRLQGDPPRP